MTDTPWQGDASSLVDAFRAGERSPREELEATLAAIEASDLNAFSHLDPERAYEAAEHADVSLPFGGVPAGVKELDAVEGWPYTDASLVFRHRTATRTAPSVERLRDNGGAVLVGLTTASEFGGLNVSVTKLNGVTHNPWQHGRTCGGSSCGTASAVSGGLVTIGTAADGGGSIRIPAGYTGLFGLKGTFGRVPRGHAATRPIPVEVHGILARSVRDTARHYDVAAGIDRRDPMSIASPGGWEAGLGSHELAGLRVAVIPSLGGVTLEPGVEDRLREHAAALIAATGMKQVEVDVTLPNVTTEWAMGNISSLIAELGELWPSCAGDLTQSIEHGLRLAEAFYNIHTAAAADRKQLQLDLAMQSMFEQADIVFCATNPGPAFAAEDETSKPFPPNLQKVIDSSAAALAVRAALGGVRTAAGLSPALPTKMLTAAASRIPELLEMGGLTIASNIHGNPAASIPAGLVNGLPVGLQVLAPHHHDALLLDVGLAAERELPWPITAAAARNADAAGGIAP